MPESNKREPDRDEASAYDDETRLTPVDEPLFEPHLDAMQLTPPEAGDSLLGVTIGNYHIEGMIGKGGFGAVYLARDVKLDRDVALKFLKQPLLDQHREHFAREAKAIAALSNHPGIVQIYGWDEYNKYVFFAMEYVPGSADKILERYPKGMPASWALRIVRESAAALGHAHNEKFLHRDIKPENILINEQHRQVKLADFGLVSVLDRDATWRPEERISGSPPYMSPEQASGQSLDARTDIYSLGVTLYRLLCGQLPVDGESVREVLEKVRADDRVPLRAWRDDLDDAVYDLVDKAVAYRPEDRFQTCDEMAAAIDAVLANHEGSEDFFEAATAFGNRTTIPGVPPFARRRWRAPILALAAVLAILAAASLLLTMQGRPGPVSRPAEAAVQALERGDYLEAVDEYEALISSGLRNDDILYGLGYARLNVSEPDKAKETFGSIEEAALREEGHGAVAYAMQREEAREQLEQLANEYNNAYAKVLLSKLDLVAQKYDDVIQRLADIEQSDLAFRWQYARALTTLGQAYFKAGDNESALQVFRMLAEIERRDGVAVASPVAGAYLDILEKKANAELREATLARAEDLGERIDAGEVPVLSEEDLWTSRRLRFLVLPAETHNSQYAVESGLSDVLPDLLGRALEANPKLDWIDREELDVTLAEQELTSYLSSESGRLQLGRLLGARLIIEGEFQRLFGDETLLGKVVDAETTALIPVEELPLLPGTPPREAVRDFADKVVERIERAYPLKGRLMRTAAGLEVDLGGALAVAPGTRFVVTKSADLHAAPLADAMVEVTEVISSDASRVRIEGAGLAEEAIPDDGLYVIEAGWHREHGAGNT